MQEVILLKLGEIVLKGLNRNTFEGALLKNIRRRLAPVGPFDVRFAQSTISITPGPGADFEAAVDRVRKIFGVITFSRACVTEKTMESVVHRRGGIPAAPSSRPCGPSRWRQSAPTRNSR